MQFLFTLLDTAALLGSGFVDSHHVVIIANIIRSLAAPAVQCGPDPGPDPSPYVAPSTHGLTVQAACPARMQGRIACEFTSTGCAGHNRQTGYTQSCCRKKVWCGDVVRVSIPSTQSCECTNQRLMQYYLTFGSQEAFDACATDGGKRNIRFYDNTSCNPFGK